MIHGFGTSRFLKKRTLSELLFGNEKVEIETRIRNDNASVVERVRPINSLDNERRSNGMLESNTKEFETKPCLALSNITGP